LVFFDPKSYEYRLFSYENLFDEDYSNDDNILERNESDESGATS